MIVGQRIALAALAAADRGIVERPWGSNDDGDGGWIRACQRFWGMGAGTSLGPQPWCGMGADRIFRDAGIDDHGLCHPSTWETCRRADAMDGARRQGTPVPGSIVINCGTHIEILVAVRSSGLLECVGANVNQGIRETVRDPREWRVIEVPGLRAGGEPETVRVYWFEDPSRAPERFGGWRTRDARTRWIEEHIPQAQRHLVRLVRLTGKPAPYALDLYSGADWKWGPWHRQEGKQTRDESQDVVERRLGRTLRARSREIPAEGATRTPARRARRAGGLTSGDTTT